MDNKKSEKVVLEKLIKITPGKRHAWYQSNMGKIRKPIKPEYPKK